MIERMRIAGLRWGEAVARAVLRTATSRVMPPSRRRGLAIANGYFGGICLLFASVGLRVILSSAAAGLFECFGVWSAVRRRRQECDSSPPRGAAANCAVLKNRNISLNYFSYVTFCSDKR